MRPHLPQQKSRDPAADQSLLQNHRRFQDRGRGSGAPWSRRLLRLPSVGSSGIPCGKSCLRPCHLKAGTGGICPLDQHRRYRRYTGSGSSAVKNRTIVPACRRYHELAGSAGRQFARTLLRFVSALRRPVSTTKKKPDGNFPSGSLFILLFSFPHSRGQPRCLCRG